MAARAKKKTVSKKKAAKKTAAANQEQDKSIESWIWDAACSIRGAKDAPKYKDFILPLILDKAKPKARQGKVLLVNASRYIHTADAETYRPIAGIVHELRAIEIEARQNRNFHRAWRLE